MYSSGGRELLRGELNCEADASAWAGVLAVRTHVRLLEMRAEDEQVCPVPPDHQPEDQDLHLKLHSQGIVILSNSLQNDAGIAAPSVASIFSSCFPHKHALAHALEKSPDDRHTLALTHSHHDITERLRALSHSSATRHIKST